MTVHQVSNISLKSWSYNNSFLFTFFTHRLRAKATFTVWDDGKKWE